MSLFQIEILGLVYFCVYACICTHVWGYMHMCKHLEFRRQSLLQIGFLTVLEFLKQIRLAGQQATGIYLSLPLHLGQEMFKIEHKERTTQVLAFSNKASLLHNRISSYNNRTSRSGFFMRNRQCSPLIQILEKKPLQGSQG